MPEQPAGWGALVVRLLTATALWFVLPSLFLAAYVLLMHAPAAAVLPHFFVVATLAVGLAGARLLISLCPLSADMRRLLSACLISVAIVGMACLYAASLIGLKSWGRVATVNLLSTYVVQAPALLRTLGYTPELVFAGCAMVLLAEVVVVYRFLLLHDWVTTCRACASPWAAVVTAAGLLATFVVCQLGFEDRHWGQEGEPLSLSLYPWQGDHDMQSHRMGVFRAKQLESEDAHARAAYVPAPAGRSRSNVILIVVDAMRADRLSLFGYGRKNTPDLEALRSKGIMRLATSALAVCNESACGLQAIASSRYLDRHANHPLTLHEVLKKHGYQVHLLFSGDHTNFYGLDRIYGSVDSYFDGSSQKARYINDDRLVLERLKSFPPSDGSPTFFQFHLMSVHALGERFAETPSYGPESNYAGDRWRTSETELPHLVTNHYDRGILQADGMISKLLSQLETRGYLKDALVVITGDHGDSLGERGLYNHSHSVWEESLRVPFLVLAFGKADPGKLIPGPALSQIDIAPSVLRMLGMPQPTTWQGSTVQDPIQRRFVHFQQRDLIGLVDTASQDGLYKHWVDTRSGRLYTFNLTTDPEERVDITSKVPLSLRQQWRNELLLHAGALSTERREALRGIPLGD